MVKICYENTALHSGKAKSCLHPKAEKKLYWNYTELFLGAEEELEEVGDQPTFKVCLRGSWVALVSLCSFSHL